jgi:HEAT repeat protein
MYELDLMELQSVDAGVRFEAARRLGSTPNTRTTEALIQALQDSDSKVQYAVVSSLIKHGDSIALQPMLDMLLAAPHSAVWKLIVLSAGLRLRAGLLDMVATGDAATADRAATALDSAAFNAHQHALFVRMLGRAADPRHADRLLGLLGHDDDVLRAAAADALGWQGDAQAVAPLLAILAEDADHEAVREIAAESLGRLGDPAAVEPLIAALGHSSEWLRRAAAASLGDLGDARALDPLAALLHDESVMVQDAAFESIKKLSTNHYTTVI